MDQAFFISEIAPKCRIGQAGFFTRDIFQAMENWDKVQGINNWILYEHTDERIQNVARVNGLCEEKFKFYCACANTNGIQLELIQPVYGLPFYENFLRDHGEGAHHLKLLVPPESYDEVLKYYEQNGMPVLFGAEYFGSRFYFVDSVKKLGLYLEIGNGQAPNGAPDEWKFPYPECMKRNPK